MDFQTLKLEMQKRSRDLGQLKQPGARHGELLNAAVGKYPRALWPRNIDGTTLDTVADQLDYALSGLSDITEPSQVERVWITDDNDVKRETGRWEVRDDAGSLTLVLDEPPSGAYDITLQYATPPDSMTDPTDVTQADDEWLLAQAMVLLMGEADWSIEEPQKIVAQLEYWDATRNLRERELLRKRNRTHRKPRTTAWRQYV